MFTLSIRGTIRIALGILALGFVALLITMQWSASRIQQHLETASNTLFPGTLSSQQAEAEFQKLTKQYSDAVLLQDKSKLAQSDESVAALKSDLESISKQSDLKPERKKQVADLISAVGDLSERSKTTYTAMIENSANISQKTQESVATLARDDKTMEADLHGLRTNLGNDFQAELNAITSWSHSQRSVGLILFLVTAVCAAALSVMVERRLAAPLQKLAYRLKDIAEGEGDLTRRLEIMSNDELGEVSSSFNRFMDKLLTVMKQVASSTQEVSLASGKLSEVSQRINANSEETSSQVRVASDATEKVNRNLQTVATATEQMNASIADIAKNVTEAARVAGEALRTAEETNSVVSKLGQSSADIGQVIKVVTSIAQKTDLLALNATVEAARAGEVGAGFAVVANEVKELAKQTAGATEDISRKVEQIQLDTKKAVEAIHNISKIIEQMNSISSTIASAMEEQSATTKEMSRNISDAARGSGEVSENIAGVAQAARSTSRGSVESLEAVKSLAEMSTRLRELVEKFKLDESANEPSSFVQRQPTWMQESPENTEDYEDLTHHHV